MSRIPSKVNPRVEWALTSVRTPHGNDPFRGWSDAENFLLDTQERWDTYQWNPPGQHVDLGPDPTASPKPTWDDILHFVRLTALEDAISELDGLLHQNAGLRDSLARKVEVVIAGKRAGIGRGFDHLTGLVHMVEHANHAGEYFPHVTMRHLDGEPATLFLQRDVRGMLAEAAVYKNAIESAHNELASKYIKLEIIARDRAQPLEEREKAAAQSLQLRKSYPTDLPKAVEAFDPDRLPADLPTLRAVYLERLEAAALAKVKSLRGVVSQQGVDLPASCADEAEAAEAVAREERLGALAVQAAADRDGATAAYDAALAKIAAVTPLNVPEIFDASDMEVTADIAVTQAAVLDLVARHPAGKDIPGLVAVAARVVNDAAGAFVTLDSWPDRTTIALSPPDTAGETAEYRIEARNLCGPARALSVEITRPAS